MRKVIVVIAILFIATFLFFVVKKTFMDKAVAPVSAPTMNNEQPSNQPATGGQLNKNTTCDYERLQCPDGSYVKRIGDTCEFQQCPGEMLDVPMGKPAGL